MVILFKKIKEEAPTILSFQKRCDSPITRQLSTAIKVRKSHHAFVLLKKNVLIKMKRVNFNQILKQARRSLTRYHVAYVLREKNRI